LTRVGAGPAIVLTPEAARRAMQSQRSIPETVAFWCDPDAPAPGALVSAVEAARFRTCVRAATSARDATRPLGFVVSSECAPDGRAEYACMPMTRIADGAVLGYLSFARKIRARRGRKDVLALDLWVDHVYVLPGHRGCGHGAALGAALLGVVAEDLDRLAPDGAASGIEVSIHADFVSEGGAALVTRIVERLGCSEGAPPWAGRIASARLVGGW
jgi:GNAT superfamily N-acetyltransferase